MKENIIKIRSVMNRKKKFMNWIEHTLLYKTYTKGSEAMFVQLTSSPYNVM